MTCITVTLGLPRSDWQRRTAQWHRSVFSWIQFNHQDDSRLYSRIYIYTGCFTTCGYYCRRWFPRSLWSKKFIVDKKNQLDVTFCILYFSSNSCSTCFGQPCAHHHDLTTAWCYSLVLVSAVAAGSLSIPVGNLPADTAHTNTKLKHHAVVSSWWWAHGCPKHVEQLLEEK